MLLKLIIWYINYNKYPNQYSSFVCDTWINFFNSAAVYIEGSVRGQWATIKFSNILPPHCFRGSLARCTAVSPAGSKTLRIETGSLRQGGGSGVLKGVGDMRYKTTHYPHCVQDEGFFLSQIFCPRNKGVGGRGRGRGWGGRNVRIMFLNPSLVFCTEQQLNHSQITGRQLRTRII